MMMLKWSTEMKKEENDNVEMVDGDEDKENDDELKIR